MIELGIPLLTIASMLLYVFAPNQYDLVWMLIGCSAAGIMFFLGAMKGWDSSKWTSKPKTRNQRAK